MGRVLCIPIAKMGHHQGHAAAVVVQIRLGAGEWQPVNAGHHDDRDLQASAFAQEGEQFAYFPVKIFDQMKIIRQVVSDLGRIGQKARNFYFIRLDAVSPTGAKGKKPVRVVRAEPKKEGLVLLDGVQQLLEFDFLSCGVLRIAHFGIVAGSPSFAFKTNEIPLLPQYLDKGGHLDIKLAREVDAFP